MASHRFLGLFLILSAGCGLQASPPPQVDTTVRWTVKDFRTGKVGCPADFPKITVEAKVAEDDFIQGFTAEFDCAAGTGTLPLYKAGDVEREGPDGNSHTSHVTGHYLVRAFLAGPLGETFRAESLPRAVDVQTGKTTADLEIWPDANFFLLAWNLTSTAGEHPGCAALGVSAVEIRYVLRGDAANPVVTDRFPCEHSADGFGYSDATGTGVSGPVEVDSYTGTLYAFGAGGAELAHSESFAFTTYGPGEGSLYDVTNIPVALAIPR